MYNTFRRQFFKTLKLFFLPLQDKVTTDPMLVRTDQICLQRLKRRFKIFLILYIQIKNDFSQIGYFLSDVLVRKKI